VILKLNQRVHTGEVELFIDRLIVPPTAFGRACSICSECNLGITSDKSLTEELLTE
jgi:hypothetical protein